MFTSQSGSSNAGSSSGHPNGRATSLRPYSVEMRIVDGPTFRAVSLPVIAGILARAIPVLAADFPLNDGGLFYAMTRDIQQANYLLPATTSYNQMDIPLSYPPLGFYAAGILSDISGFDLLDVFRFLPFIVAVLTIPVVYMVAREVLATRFQALLATWAFAFLPRAFDWLVIGGGMTRAFGILFAMLAILEGIRFYRTNRWRHGLGLASFAALTALSHPEAALFTGLSMILVLLAYRRSWKALRESIALAGLAAVIASPWWVTILMTHGVGPFLSGGQTGVDPGASFHFLVTYTFTDEPYATVFGVVATIGTVYLLAARRYLLPAWILLVFVIDPRGAATELMLPLAMIIAVAVDEVFFARVQRVADNLGPGLLWPAEIVGDRFARALLGAGLILGVIGSVKAPGAIGSPLHALAPADREAMAWIAASAPPSTRFLVVSGSSWFIDPNSEWFPVLTGHQSLATVQGYEWLGKRAFDLQLDRSYQLQVCTWVGPDCVDEWIERYHTPDAWLYVPKTTLDTFSSNGDCCKVLRNALANSPDWEVVYVGRGGAVFRPRG